jgi:cytochrome c biogenesis protein CcmG, thiol:disulfide interchange protein DsbE
MRHRTSVSRLLACTIALAALALGACGDDDPSDPGAGNPQAAAGASEFERLRAGAPPKLAAVYRQGDALLDGGAEAFEAELERLRPYPVVVNKWASWCGPCRFEFPFFQAQAVEHGDEVAFLGVDSDDSEDAAETFLDQLPLPYPSFSDPDQEIARLFDAREFPSTAFYDRSGALSYVRRGGYGSEQELAADIERWAR